MAQHLSGEVVIRRRPEEVFDFVADETNEPRYNPGMARAEKLTEGPIGVGSRFGAMMGRGRRGFPMTMEVTGFDRPHRLASRTTMAGMDVDGAVTFTADGPAGDMTRLRWDWDLEPRGWLRAIVPLAPRLLSRWEARNWRRLKQHLEQGDAASGGHLAIPSAGGPLAAYLAIPTGSGPWPGVVVVHDVLGMSEDLCRQADWLASQGFLAAAPDLFQGRGPARCMVSTMRQARARSGPMFDAIDQARAWVAGRPDCTGAVGIIGFCLGGGLALLVAPTGRYGAASINYGTSSASAFEADFLRTACPIVASYGATDRANRGSAARLSAALTAAGVDHDVKEYPGVGHGFINDHDGAGDHAPMLFAVMGRLVPGQGYDEAAATDARTRISSFFHHHLDPAV